MSTVEFILIFVVTLPCIQAQPPLHISVNIAAIRLTNPQSNQTNAGLVEVQLDSGGPVWGSICGRNRTILEVNIICQMMGYKQGQQTFKGNYGVGSKNFLLENMTCPSNATSLDNCTHYFLKTCGPQDDELYVVCQPTAAGGGSPLKYFFTPSSQPGYPSLQIPLPVLSSQILGPICQSNNSAVKVQILSGDGNDTYGMGYVQLQLNGTWVYVCQNNWNRAAAIVACREMCFSSLNTAQKFIPQPGIVRNYVPNPVNPTIGISEVICTGSEKSLFDCNYTTSPGMCLQSAQPTLAGIQCLPQNNTKIQVPHPDVDCDNGVISAIFYTSTFPYITQYNVDVIPPVSSSCFNKTYNSTLFQISIGSSSGCGTVLNDNGTHLTFENTIRYVWLNNNLKSYQYSNERYHLVCIIPKTNVVTNRYQPFTLSPLTDLYGQSDFTLTLELYTDITFETQVTMIGGTYLVEVGDWINAAIVMHSNDDRLKVVTVDCDALPVLPMATTVPVEKLIHNKCPSHPSLSMYELDNFKQGFRFQAIFFSGYSMAYIRCTATVCLSKDPSCARMCQSPDRRRRRDTSDTNTVDKQIQSLNILLYDPQSPDFEKLKSQILTELDVVPDDDLSTNKSQSELSRASGFQADELQIANTLNHNTAHCLHLNNLLLLFATLTLTVSLFY